MLSNTNIFKIQFSAIPQQQQVTGDAISIPTLTLKLQIRLQLLRDRGMS